MRILSRVLACVVIAIPLGRWMQSDSAAKLERYRSLSHDALLAVLQELNKPMGGEAYVVAALMVASAYLVVLGLGRAIERLIAYLRGTSIISSRDRSTAPRA